MKILMVNKFLYPNGGSETYMFELGEALTKSGHSVEYFGMEDERNIVGNKAGSYTSNMNFQQRGVRQFLYPFKIIYSFEARRKIRAVIETFKPDIVHLNNYNFQLTPAILYEIKKFGLPVIQTVHDYQMACPNYKFYHEQSEMICEDCLCGKYRFCIKKKCVKNSRIKSLIAAIEAYYYHRRNTYDLIDRFVCPSRFLAEKIARSGINEDKLEVLHNFSKRIDQEMSVVQPEQETGTYGLYFGRLSHEKGIRALLSVCRELPDIPFVFAGNGPLADELREAPNINYAGFLSGKELTDTIRKASFTLCPSKWYENCPFSVIESLALATPVVASDYGGTKELVIHENTGILYDGRDAGGLKEAVIKMWSDEKMRARMRRHCIEQSKRNSLDMYTGKIIGLYRNLCSKEIKGGA